jgi:predicted PurR-regulated permease PerM
MTSEEKSINNEAYYQRAVSAFLRITFVALIFVLSFMILKPFIVMVLWGIIIAVGVYPIFKKLSNLIGGKDKLASTIMVIVALAAITIPSILLLDSTIDSVKEIAAKYDEGNLVIPPPGEDIAEWPVIGKPIYETWKLASTNLDAALKTLEPQIKEYGPQLINSVAGLGGTILLSIISIIIAGVLLLKAESGEKTTQKILEYLIGKDGEELTSLTISTIRSVVQGVLGVAIIQSVAAGIVMLLFDIPMAGLWALGVLFLAIIQLPPTLIMLPVAIYGFSIMDTTSAIIFLILSIIISIADTFLKPLFLGRGVDVPMLVILLGAIGGMILMGIMGLFVGAIILALAYKIYEALVSKEG